MGQLRMVIRMVEKEQLRVVIRVVNKQQFRVVIRMVKRGSLGWLLGW